MINRRLLRIILLSGALLAWGCSKDDGPSDPGGGGQAGAGGQFATELASFDQAYFAGHAATFRSLEVLAPFIFGVVAPGHESAASGAIAAKAACFPNLVAGNVYVLIDNVYMPSDRSGAGPDAIRFVLYAVDLHGNLDPQTETGYLELTCNDAAGLLLTARVVELASPDSPVLEFTLNGDGVYYEMSGWVRPAQGTNPLSVFVQYDDVSYERGRTVTLEVPGVMVAYGMRDYMVPDNPGTVDYTHVGFGAWKMGSGGYLDWEVHGGLYVSTAGQITNGDLVHSDEYGVGKFVGCFSGSLDQPILLPASEAQCEQVSGEYELGQISQDELNAYHVGFMAMAAIFETVTSLLQVGLVVGGV